MANYKKTNALKKMQEEEELLEVQETVEEETPVAASAPKKRQFQQTDGVRCRSVTRGLLNVIGQKTGINYRWFDYGDETEMEYRDLVAEVRSRSASVSDPRIIVEDEDFIEEYPQLAQFYEAKHSVRDLRRVLNLPVDKMKAEILDMPKSVYPNLKSIVGTMIRDGQLDSIKKIKVLNELLDVDLNFFSELFE